MPVSLCALNIMYQPGAEKKLGRKLAQIVGVAIRLRGRNSTLIKQKKLVDTRVPEGGMMRGRYGEIWITKPIFTKRWKRLEGVKTLRASVGRLYRKAF